MSWQWLKQWWFGKPLPPNVDLRPPYRPTNKQGSWAPWDGRCPDCGSERWFEGPSGGMSTNIKCAGCGIWLNHTPALGIAERLSRKD